MCRCLSKNAFQSTINLSVTYVVKEEKKNMSENSETKKKEKRKNIKPRERKIRNIIYHRPSNKPYISDKYVKKNDPQTLVLLSSRRGKQNEIIFLIFSFFAHHCPHTYTQKLTHTRGEIFLYNLFHISFVLRDWLHGNFYTCTLSRWENFSRKEKKIRKNKKRTTNTTTKKAQIMFIWERKKKRKRLQKMFHLV